MPAAKVTDHSCRRDGGMRTQQLTAMQSPVPERTDWATPPAIFAGLDAEFGFTLDVCASPHNAKVSRYFTRDDDGIQQAWSGVCFCNPPYGREISKWVRKASQEAERGVTTVMLIPARTDTSWWHRYIESQSEVRFIRGRIRFVGAHDNAPFPSAIVIFRGRQP
jgi:site-specific DNA-methyltransferase (adenine-specific)